MRDQILLHYIKTINVEEGCSKFSGAGCVDAEDYSSAGVCLINCEHSAVSRFTAACASS